MWKSSEFLSKQKTGVVKKTFGKNTWREKRVICDAQRGTMWKMWCEQHVLVRLEHVLMTIVSWPRSGSSMTTRFVELVCGFDQVVPQSSRSKNISPTMVSSQGPSPNKTSQIYLSAKMPMLEYFSLVPVLVKSRRFPQSLVYVIFKAFSSARSNILVLNY